MHGVLGPLGLHVVIGAGGHTIGGVTGGGGGGETGGGETTTAGISRMSRASRLGRKWASRRVLVNERESQVRDSAARKIMESVSRQQSS